MCALVTVVQQAEDLAGSKLGSMRPGRPSVEFRITARAETDAQHPDMVQGVLALSARCREESETSGRNRGRLARARGKLEDWKECESGDGKSEGETSKA